MSERDPLAPWKDTARARMVPHDFADRLLLQPASPVGWAARLWARPAVRAATWLVASVALAARVVALFAFFLLG